MTGLSASEFHSSSGQLPDSTAPFAQFDQMSRSMLAGTTQFNASVQALNKEWTEFIGKRLQEEAQLFHALGECKTLSEAQSAYARFWENAFSQYSEEAQRVVRIAQSAVATASRG